MSLLRICLLACALVAAAQGHAVLVTPTAFNTNPSTTFPCGVPTISAAMNSTAKATWVPGTNVTILWHLVAEDGDGSVYGAFDPLGGTNFTVPAWTDSFTTAGAPKYFNKTFTVPVGLSCLKSPTKLCSFRVYTATKWNSCTTVGIATKASSDSEAPIVSECTPVPKATNLTFCNGTNILIRSDLSPSDVNSEIVGTFNMNKINPLVFTNGNSPACQASYQQLLCSLNMPTCDPNSGQSLLGSSACHAQCAQTMNDCGLVQAHVNLYPCSSYPLCPGESAGGGGPSEGMSPGGKAALSLFIIGLVLGSVVAVYIYRTRGHLFGYTYDSKAKKIVKYQTDPQHYRAYTDSDL